MHDTPTGEEKQDCSPISAKKLKAMDYEVVPLPHNYFMELQTSESTEAIVKV
jgi:hypothetical protein